MTKKYVIPGLFSLFLAFAPLHAGVQDGPDGWGVMGDSPDPMPMVTYTITDDTTPFTPFFFVYVRGCTAAEENACESSCQASYGEVLTHKQCAIGAPLYPGYREPNVGGLVHYCGCRLEPARPGLMTNTY